MLGPRHGTVTVDLVERGQEPAEFPWVSIVTRQTFRDNVPWDVDLGRVQLLGALDRFAFEPIADLLDSLRVRGTGSDDGAPRRSCGSSEPRRCGPHGVSARDCRDRRAPSGRAARPDPETPGRGRARRHVEISACGQPCDLAKEGRAEVGSPLERHSWSPSDPSRLRVRAEHYAADLAIKLVGSAHHDGTDARPRVHPPGEGRHRGRLGFTPAVELHEAEGRGEDGGVPCQRHWLPNPVSRCVEPLGRIRRGRTRRKRSLSRRPDTARRPR